MIQLQNNRNYIIYLFLLYFLSNLFLLLNIQGVYWDDWALTTQSPEIIKSIFEQNAHAQFGFLHLFLAKIGNGIYIYRVVLFFSYFIAGVCLYSIIQSIKFFDRIDAFFITLLFLLAPVNDARIALINSVAIVAVVLFYYAFFLLTRYLSGKTNLIYRFVILILFAISFSLESLLVLYAVVLIYIAYILYEQNKDKSFKALTQNYFTHYFDFICLPALFFVLKNAYWKPYGAYENYNAFNTSFTQLLHFILESFGTSLYTPIVDAYIAASNHLIVTAIIFAISIYVINKAIVNLKSSAGLTFKHKLLVVAPVLLVVGLFLFVLAVFPYCAVGKPPQNGNWNSRNQVLVPLGFAFIIYYLIFFSAVLNKKLPSLLLCGMISLFMVQNLNKQFSYYIDWIYQYSLLSQMKQSSIIYNHSTFIVKDEFERDVWVNKGTLSINWLLKNAFEGEDHRLIVKDIRMLESLKNGKRDPNHYASQWSYDKPVYLEFMKNSEIQLTRWQEVQLIWDSLFKPDIFANEVEHLTKIKAI